jgi:hypothetical protein
MRGQVRNKVSEGNIKVTENAFYYQRLLVWKVGLSEETTIFPRLQNRSHPSLTTQLKSVIGKSVLMIYANQRLFILLKRLVLSTSHKESPQFCSTKPSMPRNNAQAHAFIYTTYAYSSTPSADGKGIAL